MAPTMCERLVNVDRETPMLLPDDLREWVPALSVNQRGSASRQYPPRMMLALVISCYANGQMSSRRIQRARYRDLAVLHSAREVGLLKGGGR